MYKISVSTFALSMTICGSALAQSAPSAIPAGPDGDRCAYQETDLPFELAPLTCETGLSFDVFADEPLFATMKVSGNANFVATLLDADPLPVVVKRSDDDGDHQQLCESQLNPRTLSSDGLTEEGTFRVYLPANALAPGQYVYNFGIFPLITGFGFGDFRTDCSFTINVRDRNSNDLDNDGIPNDQDICADTPADAVVNQEGCSISQECPCDDLWCGADSYVRCVRSVSLEMVLSGTISWSERFQFVSEAETSGCGSDSEATWLDALLGRCNTGYGWGW